MVNKGQGKVNELKWAVILTLKLLLILAGGYRRLRSPTRTGSYTGRRDSDGQLHHDKTCGRRDSEGQLNLLTGSVKVQVF